MRLQACLNGARGRFEHGRLAIMVDAVLAEEAIGAVSAGARSLHVHPKDDRGADSLRPRDVGTWVSALRDLCPGVPVGVTTGEWGAPDAATRSEWVAEWLVLPDFASVNWHEEGAEEVAHLLLAHGVDVEAGLWNAQAARRFASSPSRGACFRILVELPDVDRDEVGRAAFELIAVASEAAPQAAILLHGEERSAWPALDLAIDLGLETRIGLEDTLVLPDGSRASGNPALVTAALGRAGSVTRSR
ncbi:3-keto-5-aminohexanoate cleavage protein [Microbacterium sp.]|uniref:3-keto-5-aminohexanoate cleavage protein n=1 Tax=Microbacterium sp. TaxID=51671 RepID=UPI0028120229|nr:3-keto-5-aminohexanoate cleavage protein [Microbacterium sp.]